ncbi:MAG: glycosyltransferase family 4 protein [Parvularculaceae bacterium]|nr:glycosyltransferase family 4 protein [Parvularculaceae bacterium]
MPFDKTVLQVIPAMDAGGAERTTLEMARAIVAAGGRAIVATSAGRMIADLERAGAHVALMPVQSKNPLTIMSNAGRLSALIRAQRVDIIHARSRAPAWSSLVAARRTGAAFVTTWHGAYRSGSPWKRFYNSAMARGDLVIANSAFTAASIRAAGDPGERLKVIHRGADTDEFNPRAIGGDRVDALLTKWGLEKGLGPLLLLPGRLTDWKGHSLAIEALQRLPAKVPAGAMANLRLIFAGDAQGRDGYASSLLRGVREQGQDRMIRFVGHCDDMPAAYAAADVVLSPSTRPEAFGRIAAEAGAMERIAIAADHGGQRETIIDGETGFLVKPGSADALATAIATAMSMSAVSRAAMGTKARARIASLFSAAAMTAATLDAYRMVLGDGVRAA